MLRDSARPTLGSASTVGNTTTFHDSAGRTTGTATIRGSRTVFRDAAGLTLGTATTSVGGTTTYRDAAGRTLSTRSDNGSQLDVSGFKRSNDQHGAANRVRSDLARFGRPHVGNVHEHGNGRATAAWRSPAWERRCRT